MKDTGHERHGVDHVSGRGSRRLIHDGPRWGVQIYLELLLD